MPDRDGVPGQSTEVGCPFFLSQRQRQTLILAAHGQTDVEIGRRLHLATSTVRFYLRQARRRLGALNTTHAVAIALVVGLIELDSNFIGEAVRIRAATG